MARTALTTVTPIDENGTIAADAAAYVYTAADDTDGNSFVFTGREIILVRNVSVDTDATITLSSVANALGRTKDVVYTVGFGEFAVFGPFPLVGWQQSGGNFHLIASSDDIELCILRLPAIQ